MKFIFFTFLLVIATSSIAQDTIIETYTKNQLLSDYDLAVSSLKEGHTGLYWYTNYVEYEKIFKENRNKIKEGMNSYEFFRIISQIVSADREGHSEVYRSTNIRDYVNHKAKLLPVAVKPIGEQLYIINDIENYQTKGFLLKKINNVEIDTIIKTIFNHQSTWSDGYTKTGKYDNIEYFNFSLAYHYYIDDFKSDSLSIELQNPNTNELKSYKISLIKRDELLKLAKQTPFVKLKNDDKLFNLEYKPEIKTSILTFNDFGYSRYEEQKTSFETVVDSLFSIIKKNKTKNLIIDIRNNSGGSEGAEDYLFSHLAKRQYKKYQYVEAKAFHYTFLKGTNYNSDEDRKELEDMLIDEHYLATDGRILRKESVLPTAKPKENIYEGKIYIITSGKTYSGGSEFASIAKDQSKAIFIGQETGGGFYGQTSGNYVHQFLPETNVHIRIPLLKFATTFKSDDIPFGRGVIPDYKIEQTFEEYMNGIDAQMEFTLNLIKSEK